MENDQFLLDYDMQPDVNTEKGLMLPPPPSKQYARAKLSNATEVSWELAKLYREARSGRIDVADASRLANMLAILARILSDSEIEARISALERCGWR